MGIQELLQEARELESRGKYKDASVIYQKVFDRDHGNTGVTARLLIIYRKLKEYRKGLAVVDAALANFRQRENAIQRKWIKDHPKAAGIGRSMLRKMKKGVDELSALGADPKVAALLKRRALIAPKVKGYKAPAPVSSLNKIRVKKEKPEPPVQKLHPVRVNQPRQAPVICHFS